MSSGDTKPERFRSRLSLTLDETSPAMRNERGHKTSLGEIGLVVLPRAEAPTCAESNCDSLFEYLSVHSSVKLGREVLYICTNY